MPVYTFTTLDDPLGMAAVAFGISDAGQVVGAYTDANLHGEGFLYSGGPSPPSTIRLAPAARMHAASTTRARSSGITPTPAAPTASSTAAVFTPPSMIT